MDNQQVLVVEDEVDLARVIAGYLQNEGFTVRQAHTGPDAVALAQQDSPALIVLDLMLPGFDGIEVCRQIRGFSDCYIIMLTARDDEIDRVVGLEVGADDYLTKPFSMRELMARVKAQLRRARLIEDEWQKRAPEPTAQDVLTFDNLAVNRTRREVTLDGAPIQLKPQEYQLLLFFAEHRGQMLSREFILERVWGWDFIGDSRTVDVHVRWLRQKIEADAGNPTRIVTVRGGGYRFEG